VEKSVKSVSIPQNLLIPVLAVFTITINLYADQALAQNNIDPPIKTQGNITKPVQVQDSIAPSIKKQGDIAKPVRVQVHNKQPTKAKTKRIHPATLKELYDLTAHKHPELKAGAAGRDAADISVTNAYFGLLPRATLTIDNSNERQEVFRTDNPTYQVGSGVYDGFQRSIEVIQPIADPRVFAQLNAANAASDRAHSEYDSISQDFIYSLIKTYLSALSAHDAESVAASETKAVQAHLEEMSVRKRAGLVQIGDVSEVKARLETAKAQRANAAAAMTESFASLERNIGGPVEALAPLSASIAMVPPLPAIVDDWVTAARRHNPDLHSLQAAARVAGAQVYSDFAADLPRLEFHYTDTHLKTGGSLYGGGSTTSDRVAMLRLTIPLFNAAGTGYAAFADRQRQMQAQYQSDTKRFEIDAQVKTAFSEVKVSIQRTKMLENAVKAQANTVAAKQERFRSGLTSVTSVLDAERDYYQARRALLGARYNYLLSMMQLKRLAGDISPSDLSFLDDQTDPDATPVRPIYVADGR